MKKTLLFLLINMLSFSAYTQITQDASYTYSGTFTRLSVSGDKFFVMDVLNSQCRIYNTNHTLWKTINLSVPSNNYLYDIQYISENLFTTDNSLCLVYTYYLYDETNQYYTYTTKVVKENGTVLLSLPGCQYYYATTLQNGSTKFVTYSYDYSVWPYTVLTGVYSLPGSLVTSALQLPAEQLKQQLYAHPNPASTQVVVGFDVPENATDARFELRNASGQLMLQQPLMAGQKQLPLNVDQFPSGIYIYSVQVDGQAATSQKLIIQ